MVAQDLYPASVLEQIKICFLNFFSVLFMIGKILKLHAVRQKHQTELKQLVYLPCC